MLKPLAITVLGTFSVAACFGVSRPNMAEFATEVQALVPYDGQMSTAVARLGRAGFGCNGFDPIQCSRNRGNCIERISIFVDTEHFKVTRVDFPPSFFCLATP